MTDPNFSLRLSADPSGLVNGTRQAQDAITGVSMSARELQFALRGVGAQFTDIVTGLASGQAPLTVLIQQGGQLKDMFGGVGNAARALSGYVVGLVTPMTLLGGAVVGLGLAYLKGAAESQAFSRALAESGNASGTTTLQLQQMSARMAEYAGSQSAAAAAVTEFVKGSRVGAQSLEAYAAAALQLERVGGQAVAKTADAFAALQDKPLKALTDLNASLNFVTPSLYRQIAALEQSGRATEAAQVASDAYAEAIRTQAPKIEAALSPIEQAWNRIKREAAEAVSYVLNIGRASADPLGDLQRQIAGAQIRLGKAQTTYGGLLGQFAQSSAQGELDTLRAQLPLLVASQEAEGEMAVLAARRAADTKATAEWLTLQTKRLDDNKRLEREIDEIRNKGKAAGATDAEINALISEARKKHDKKDVDEALALAKVYYDGRVALAKAAAESERAANKAAVASGLMTESEAATKDLAAALQAVSAEYDATAEMLTKLSPKSREYAALMEKLKLVVEQYSQAEAKGAAAVADAKTKETKALQAWHEEARKSNVAYEKHVEAVEADAKAAELDVLQMGLSQFALAALTATRIEAVISQKEATLAAAEYAAVTDGETIPAIRREIEALKKKRDAVMAGGIKAAAADEQQLARENFNQIADIMVGAFERGFSHVKNLGRELKNALSQIFSQFVIRPLLQAGVGLVGSMAQGAVNGIVGGGTSNLFGSVAGNAAQSALGNYASSYLFGNAGAAFTAAMTPAATTAAMGSPALAASMYGGSAAEIVGGAALAADGTATGAGILAGMEAGLAAIPVAGWVALAALVIYGIATGMEEGAAERTGVFANAAGSKGGNPLFASSSAFGSFGVVQDQWLSNDSGFVSAMTDILNSVKSVDNAVAAIIGKDNTALVSAALASQTTNVSFGMEDANLDSVRGMSASQILVARYKVVLNTLDEGLGDVLDNFKGSGADLATMITSLVSFSQASKKFPKDIHDNLIKALDGTADSLQKVMKYANAFSVYQTLAGQDRNELVNSAILAQQAPGNFQFTSILTAVGAAADEFDGSAESAAALAAGLQDLQAASVNLIASFVAAKNDLHDLFTGTIRDIRLDLLQTPGEKIDFLRAENTSLIAQIATATSPEQIRSLGQRINQNYTTAWGLLTPEQRAAQGNDYIANLSATDTLIADRIDDVTTNIGDATDAMITKVGDLLTGAITALGTAADVMKAAAADIKLGGEAILEAANTPLVVQVEDPPLVNSP